MGLYVVRCLPAACAAMLLIQIVAGRVPGDVFEQRSWRWPPPGNVARAGILRQLKASGGKHLVFVRYAPSHDLGYEWSTTERISMARRWCGPGNWIAGVMAN